MDECSTMSLANDEPMIGTANQVDIWLMFEYRGEWKAKATTDNELSPRATAWIAAFEQQSERLGLIPRVQFIRTESRVGEAMTLFVARGGELFRHYFQSDDELAAIDPFDTDQAPLDQRHYFVCVHGQRDQCCARWGSISFRELRAQCPDRTWRTSHLGGHRFAPNILILPDNLLYGRVTSNRIEDLVRHAEQGRIHKPCIRGRGNYPSEQQVAEILAKGQVTRIVDLGSGRFRCHGEYGEELVTVEPPITMSVLASCRDDAPKPVEVFKQTV